MSFLQPLFLAGLALAALPVVIHLINQRRYQTVRWGAMMFLLAAHRMSQGFARLRQWLILLFRVLAVACLAFVIARPLAGGWLGLASAGRADTTIVLLDRSPSMQQQDASAGQTKLAAGRRQLVDMFRQLPSSRWTLIESATNRPRELESADSLERAPETGPAGASADIPTMLQAAHDYIVANQTGRTEVWICSDLRNNDWNADDARWEALRSAFAAFPQGVRFHLLTFAKRADENLAIRLTGLRRRQTESGAELFVSLRLTRTSPAAETISVPVQFELEGARSSLTVELTGDKFELRDHPLPLGEVQARGWGRVSIPADANLADNEFFFAFDPNQTRRTVIVADDAETAEALRLAASISADAGEPCTAETISPRQAATIDWNQAALILWQSALPAGETAAQLKSLVDRGGQVIFFPPQQPGTDKAFGVRWQAWQELDEEAAVDSWRGDQDLLAHAQSGMSLGVGQLALRNVCTLSGEVTPLATLRGGAPLLARAPTPRGGVYFCATTPARRDSNLASDGVVLYVMIQRALAAGAAALGEAQLRIAGDSPDPEAAASWRRLAGDASRLSTENAWQCGAYAQEDALVAVNRGEAEDQADVLDDERLASLFRGLDYVRIHEDAGDSRSLVQEIWRTFLAAMMFALIAESWLCLPRRPTATGGQP